MNIAALKCSVPVKLVPGKYDLAREPRGVPLGSQLIHFQTFPTYLTPTVLKARIAHLICVEGTVRVRAKFFHRTTYSGGSFKTLEIKDVGNVRK